ncbi:hypothetical protein [Pseudoalteromonas sp. McH1-7]|uniref:hypothetical protein n=1 Tax=Pseudoalteromonas sp. McH1-7 TaxID=2745574 RepID=UPI0034CF4118
MTPNMINDILRTEALKAGLRGEHSYLPKTEQEAETFTHHNWVYCAAWQFAEIAHRMESAIRQYCIGGGSEVKALLDSLPKAKTLAPVEIARNELGYWDHPDWQTWDERNTLTETNDYTLQQGYRLKFIHFEDECSNEQFERYFSDGDPDISDWNPICDYEGSFLLSIYETEDGPQAVFAVPLEKVS